MSKLFDATRYLIRDSREEDLPAVVELGSREYLESRGYLAGIGWSFLSVYNGMLAIVRKEMPGESLIAEDAGRVVGGILGMYFRTPFPDIHQVWCHEVGWYVDPEYRGQGIGFALRDALYARVAQNKSADIITLGVAHTTAAWEELTGKYLRDGWFPYQSMFFKVVK